MARRERAMMTKRGRNTARATTIASRLTVVAIGGECRQSSGRRVAR
jgi:hypothetical protein